MKKSKYSVIVAVAFFLIAGCKKKNEPENPQGNVKPCSNVIETYLGGNKFSSSTMIYDEFGRLSKMTIQESIDADYSYEQDKIMVSSSGKAYYEITLSNGRATKISQVGVSSYQELTYNADGYLGTVADYDDNVLQQTFHLSYANGNLTAIKITFDDPENKKTGTVEYSSDLAAPRFANVNPLDRIVRFAPVEYLGKLSKNQVIKYTEISTPGTHRFENVTTYTYTKDGAGKFTGATEIYSNKSYDNDRLVSDSGGTFDYRFISGCD